MFMVSHKIIIVGLGLLMTEEELRYEPQVEAERRYRDRRCRVQITFNLKTDEELLEWLRSQITNEKEPLAKVCKELIVSAFEQSKK